jgi:predicted RNase H-like HicB family nuclease
MKQFTAIVHQGEPDEGGFWATCLEVPGANGQGETKEECLADLKNAIKLLVETEREEAFRLDPRAETAELVLDSFNNTLSSVAVTNVATGFAGVTQPVAIGMAWFTNSTPILQITGASNYNYLVESSTNLVNWTPTALLVNSNGAAFFADKTATNLPAKFYRAKMP